MCSFGRAFSPQRSIIIVITYLPKRRSLLTHIVLKFLHSFTLCCKHEPFIQLRYIRFFLYPAPQFSGTLPFMSSSIKISSAFPSCLTYSSLAFSSRTLFRYASYRRRSGLLGLSLFSSLMASWIPGFFVPITFKSFSVSALKNFILPSELLRPLNEIKAKDQRINISPHRQGIKNRFPALFYNPLYVMLIQPLCRIFASS